MGKRYNSYADSYEPFMESLKREILAARNFNLPPLSNFTTLEQIDSAFHPDDGRVPAPLPVPSARLRGPQYVRFVFVAGNPTEFPAGYARQSITLRSVARNGNHITTRIRLQLCW